MLIETCGKSGDRFLARGWVVGRLAMMTLYDSFSFFLSLWLYYCELLNHCFVSHCHHTQRHMGSPSAR
jgi:hypothetical protein